MQDILEGILRFLNVFFAAIVAGGQVAVLLVIIPVKRGFDTRDSVMVHNAMLGHQIDYYMKPSGLVSASCALAILALRAVGYLAVPTSSIVFMLVGLLGTIGVVICSRYFNVRTNRMMARWSLDAIPEDYPRVRRRWDTVHTIRASCGTLALVGYLIAALTD